MRGIAVPAVIAALLGLSGPVLSKETKDDADRLREIEQARKELRDAREDLRRAAEDLARASRELEPESPRARAFEFLTNPRRAVLGVGIEPGPQRKGDTRGVLITAVTPGSGAEKAGLKSGDVLLSANGKSLVTRKGERPGPERKLRDLMSELSSGDKVELEYERDGKSARTTAIAQRPEALDLGDMDFDDKDFDVILPRGFPGATFIREREGPQLAKLDADLASYFKTKEGVLVIRAPKEGDLGLKSGDVIQKIDGEAVDSPIEAMDRLRDADDEQVTLEVLRHGKRETLKGKVTLTKRHRRNRIEIRSEDHEP
jgi:S1-C subfamily serine protease